MSKTILNEYNLTNPKIKENVNIICISDIHSEIERLKEIKRILIHSSIDFILIPGDLVDTLNDERNEKLFYLLEEISKYTPIYTVIGNHDLFYDEKRKKDYDFYKEISKLKNIKVYSTLEDSKQITDSISLHGINMPLKWYKEKDNNTSFERILRKAKEATDNNFNIMLVHSPNGVIIKDRINKNTNCLKNMNLFLCGHMHAGLVPIFLRGSSHHGLVGPYKSLFPKNAYGIIQDDESSVLISGGFTKISKISEAKAFSGLFNRVLPHELELIHLNSNGPHKLVLTNRYKL